MPVTLPDPQLPGDPQDALQSIQRNFEALATAPESSVTDTATYSNGASAPSGRTLTARKYPSGQVVLSGGVARLSGFSTATTYATLPTGFRPEAKMNAAAGGDQTSLDPVTAIIDTDGTVEVTGASVGATLTSFYLDGITFHAG